MIQPLSFLQLLSSLALLWGCSIFWKVKDHHATLKKSQTNINHSSSLILPVKVHSALEVYILYYAINISTSSYCNCILS